MDIKKYLKKRRREARAELFYELKCWLFNAGKIIGFVVLSLVIAGFCYIFLVLALSLAN